MTAADVPSIPGPYLLLLVAAFGFAFYMIVTGLPERSRLDRLYAEQRRYTEMAKHGAASVELVSVSAETVDGVLTITAGDVRAAYVTNVLEPAAAYIADRNGDHTLAWSADLEPPPVGFDTDVADILDTDPRGHRW